MPTLLTGWWPSVIPCTASLIRANASKFISHWNESTYGNPLQPDQSPQVIAITRVVDFDAFALPLPVPLDWPPPQGTVPPPAPPTGSAGRGPGARSAPRGFPHTPAEAAKRGIGGRRRTWTG